MPAAAIPAWALITAAAAPAGAQVAGSYLQSRGANKATKAQVDAANYAAQQQAKSAADALAFQKQQAAQDLAIAESTQHANYDQYAARQGRLSNLSVLTGAGKQDIPAYVPIPVAPQAPPPVAAPADVWNGAPPAQGSTVTSMSALMPQRAPTPGVGGDVVMLRAPTGQTKMVPRSQVAHYQQLGAQVMG